MDGNDIRDSSCHYSLPVEPLACFFHSPFCLKVIFYELLVCNPDIGSRTVDGSLPTSTLTTKLVRQDIFRL